MPASPTSRPPVSGTIRRRSLLGAGLCLFAGGPLARLAAAGEAAKKAERWRPKTRPVPVRGLKFDASARGVNLLEAIDAGELNSRVVMKDQFGGSVLLHNATDEPLTVLIPDGLAAVHVQPQGGMMGGGGMGGMGGGGMGGGGMGGGGGQAGGGGMGGGMGGGGMGGGGMGGMGGGGGAFSIPPDVVAKADLHTVCLEYGKPTPNPRMHYELRTPESFRDDPALAELMALVGTGKLNKQAAQVAAWHLADGMTLRELAALRGPAPGPLAAPPLFSRQHLAGGQQIVAEVRRRVEDRKQGRVAATR